MAGWRRGGDVALQFATVAESECLFQPSGLENCNWFKSEMAATTNFFCFWQCFIFATRGVDYSNIEYNSKQESTCYYVKLIILKN
jgi:hypothetical protein